MPLKEEIIVTKKLTPTAAGFYWWRQNKQSKWGIMRVEGEVGVGWGLCVELFHTEPIETIGGEWGPEIIPPPD